MVRQAHHERNQYITVRPVEGFNQSFLKYPFEQSLRFLELRNSTVRYTCLNPLGFARSPSAEILIAMSPELRNQILSGLLL
jgi:hypothetical protein